MTRTWPLTLAMTARKCIVPAAALLVVLVATADASAQRTVATRPVFSGNWETGNVSQWDWLAQCANVGDPSDLNAPGRGTLDVVTSPVGQGRYAAQFTLPAYNGSGYNACEILRHRSIAVGGVYGSKGDDWYALALYFPSNWRTSSAGGWGVAIAQLNYERISGPPVGLYAHPTHVNLVLQSGYCPLYGFCTYMSGNDDDAQGTLHRSFRAIPSRQFSTDRWHQLIIHVHWATDTSGRVDVWHRILGAAKWSKTVTLTGYPTLQWTDSVPISSLPAYDQSADKIGAYRADANTQLTIWNDGFCVTTSFASAAACLGHAVRPK